MSNTKILIFAGSSAKASLNKKFALCCDGLLKNMGAQTTFIDLKDYDLPLYNADLEATNGLPANAKKLKELFAAHQGFLIACPEYNGAITPLLKNTIDWVSRPEGKQSTLPLFQDKVVALVSASPGALGGLRGLGTVRPIFSNLGSLVIAPQMALSKAHEAFAEDGKSLKDAGQQKQLEGVLSSLINTTKKQSAL